jgi:hypothetical protein
MDMRGWWARGTILIVVILLVSVVPGCLEEEKKPRPEPVVRLSGPSEAWVGEVVDFDATDCKDDDTKFEALDYWWDMGDNTTYKGKPFISEWIAAPNHTYLRPGSYMVNLTVTDVWGNEGLANVTIDVRYQLNMTVNAQGTWISEDALNNTTYFNLTIENEWTDRFDVPSVRCRLANESGGEVLPRAMSGDMVPANLTPGQSFTIQVHFVIPPDFEVVRFDVATELWLDLTSS